MRIALRFVASRWTGRLALAWLGCVVALAGLSLIAFDPDHRAPEFDASLLPPGSSEGDAIARSIIARALDDTDRGRVTKGSLVGAVEWFVPLSHEQLDRLVLDTRAIEQDALLRTEAERFVLERIGSLDYMLPLGFPLGTDALGHDVLARIVHGARTALLVGAVAAGIATILGVLIGLAMGLGGPLVDGALMRFTELVMSLPLLYVLVLAAGLLPRSTIVVMALIGCLSWHSAARFVRAECMKLREADYVSAARAAGSTRARIALRHILPNAAAPVLIDTAFAVAGAILVEATIAFLGLGAGDAVSWGSLVRDATAGGTGFNWWLGVFPGAMIFLTALSLVVLGEHLRDALDPRSRGATAPRWAYTARA